MCAYRKAIPSIGMQLRAMSLRTIRSISFPFVLYTNASRVLIFFLLASAQYNSNFMNKYRQQSSILAENQTLQNGCEQLMSIRRWDLLQVQ